MHHNLADDYGGGIRAKGENIIISGVAVHHNRALDMGGGIYIERSNTEQTVTVDNFIITNNYADDEGGGIYIYDLLLAKLNDCIIQNNAAATEGGDVFLSDHTGTDVQLSGKMIIRNNFVASFNSMYSGYKSNLFIEGEDDLIVSSLSYGSEIWVRIEDEIKDYCGIDDPITAEPTSDSPYYFFSDVADWHIALQEVPAEDNFRHLYFAGGERKSDLIKLLKDYSTKLMSQPYKVRNGEFKGREVGLYKGYCESIVTSSSEILPAIPFYYSDGYFLEDPKVYNEHLATMSACLAFSAQGLQSDANAIPGKIALSAEKGSSIFYSHDGGKTWELYSTPIDASEITSESKAFSVSYGTKSETVDIDFGVHVGSMIIDGGYAFLIGGVCLIIFGIVTAVIIKRKNKVDAWSALKNNRIDRLL